MEFGLTPSGKHVVLNVCSAIAQDVSESGQIEQFLHQLLGCIGVQVNGMEGAAIKTNVNC